MLITAISRGVARSIRGTRAEVIVPNGGLPRGLEIEVGKRQVTGHVNAKGAQGRIDDCRARVQQDSNDPPREA